MNGFVGGPAGVPKVHVTGAWESYTYTDNGFLKKSRPRQNFTWEQLAVLEQVFENDPLPWPVRAAPTRIVPYPCGAARV